MSRPTGKAEFRTGSGVGVNGSRFASFHVGVGVWAVGIGFDSSRYEQAKLKPQSWQAQKRQGSGPWPREASHLSKSRLYMHTRMRTYAHKNAKPHRQYVFFQLYIGTETAS